MRGRTQMDLSPGMMDQLIGNAIVAQRTVVDENHSSVILPSQSKVFSDAPNKIKQYRADSRQKRRNITISSTTNRAKT